MRHDTSDDAARSAQAGLGTLSFGENSAGVLENAHRLIDWLMTHFCLPTHTIFMCCTVTEAESGMEALEILRSNAPGTFSLVLTVGARALVVLHQ